MILMSKLCPSLEQKIVTGLMTLVDTGLLITNGKLQYCNTKTIKSCTVKVRNLGLHQIGNPKLESDI